MRKSLLQLERNSVKRSIFIDFIALATTQEYITFHSSLASRGFIFRYNIQWVSCAGSLVGSLSVFFCSSVSFVIRFSRDKPQNSRYNMMYIPLSPYKTLIDFSIDE